MAARKVWTAARRSARLPSLSGAACAGTDPDLWFRRDGESETSWAVRAGAAKSICARCSIQDGCRAWALTTNQEHGVFGGLDAAEREAERKRARRRIHGAAS